ncbi:MAG: hypothetical protein JWP25_8940 [Bradyrhizobium sp.]|nr:hypothetical protein [Bradyrhizobium sp.]
MTTPRSWFDPELLSGTWFDPALSARGWYDSEWADVVPLGVVLSEAGSATDTSSVAFTTATTVSEAASATETETVTQVVAFGSATNSSYQTAQPSYFWSHTCDGTNRLLIVGVSMLSVVGSSVTNITYGGVALSPIRARASVSGAVRSEMWGLIAPATGSNTIAVTLSAPLDSIAGAVSFTGANQTVAYETPNDATATNVGAANATVNVTTEANNDWCVDVLATTAAAPTVGAGQTQRNNVSGALGSGAMSTEGPNTPPGSVTMSWSGIGALKTWTTVAAGVVPVSDIEMLTTEAGAAADAPSAQVNFSVVGSESGSASDIPTASVVFATTASEVASASDTPSTATTFAATITESGAATDTPTAQVDFATIESEAASATDTSDMAGSTFNVAGSEAGSTADVPTAQVEFLATQVDGASASDSSTTSAIFAVTASEAGSALDTPSAATIATATIVETDVASDISTASIVYIAIGSETGTAVDTPTEQIVFAAVGNEAATAVDSPAAQVDYVATTVEVGATGDTATAVGILAAVASEVANANDTPSAKLIVASPIDVGRIAYVISESRTALVVAVFANDNVAPEARLAVVGVELRSVSAAAEFRTIVAEQDERGLLAA